MKVGIVVPYSWSFWGGVPEHAHHQALALRRLGVETRTLMGNDPPGQFTRVLHPRSGRHGQPPPDVIPVGRSVIVPANGALPNIILSPRSFLRVKQALERERFDVVHLHEPMTPIPCVATLALAEAPCVATHHAAGDLGWLKPAKPVWGFLLDRLVKRIAVSTQARDSAARYFPGDYEIIPNGVLIPEQADPSGRENRVVFIGRHDPRKGMEVVLRAWPQVRARTGARLRVVGADPLRVRLTMAQHRLSGDGVDILGPLDDDALTAELLAAKALAAPSLGGESFGMVLTRAFACATPAVASDIDGYREVMTSETAIAVRPGDDDALARGLIELLEDEPRRAQMGREARRLADGNYGWDDIAARLLEIYEAAVRAGRPASAVAAR
ncbi:MAG TPA: glycosyltransferase family 4 protein [Gaiellaceae bacterium]|nr:glycosyltransferase family 4 protein [Gaiellaceae bacterium]